MKKNNILFLDFDDVLNSSRSFYKKFAEHHGVEWTDDDFDPKWWDKGHRNYFAPGFSDKVDEAWEREKKKPGYEFPKLSMYDYPHDEEAIQNLNKIIEENDAKVVVCSSWRLGRTVKELQEILDGWNAKCKVIDRTGSPVKLSQSSTRGMEILNWIMVHRNEISGICVLDDSAGYDINYILEKWCVQGISGYYHGLRDIHIPMAKVCFETPINPLEDFTKFLDPQMIKEAKEKDKKNES